MALINPESISHIYPKCGLTIVVMNNGHEFTFSEPQEDFMKKMSEALSEISNSSYNR